MNKPLRWLDWSTNHLGMLVGIAAATGLVIAGLWQFIAGSVAGPLIRIDAARLEARDAPASRWAHVSGQFLPGKELRVTAGTQERSRDHYYPVVSSQWKPGDPVAVVARMPGYCAERLNQLDIDKALHDVDRWVVRMKAESEGFVQPGERVPEEPTTDKRETEIERLKVGLLHRNGLPGNVATGLAEMGYALTDPYYVLDSGSTPESEKGLGRVLVALGLAVFVITGVASAVSAWRAQARPSVELPPSARQGVPASGGFAAAEGLAPHVKLGADGRDGIMFR